MSKPFISLCPEITRANALNLMDWLEDESVIRYLSDSRNVSRFIEQVIGRVQLPILTHLFNQGGRFFMAYDRHDVPVGFVRLVKTGPDCEIVLVIGNRDNWGRKLGASALREGMKLAFFDMRAEKIIAKIHADNTRSLNAFLRCGFLLDSETPTLKSFAMSSVRYLQLLREGAAGGPSDIYITEIDQARLRDLVMLEQGPDVVDLEYEIERATVVDARQVARDVVTMNSRALLHLDDEEMEVDLVYPQDADGSAGKLSIFSGVAPRSWATRKAIPSTGGSRAGPAVSASRKCFTSRKPRAISICKSATAAASQQTGDNPCVSCWSKIPLTWPRPSCPTSPASATPWNGKATAPPPAAAWPSPTTW